MSELTSKIKQRIQAAQDYLVTKRGKWTEYENILTNTLQDSISETTKSQLFDPRLSTMTIERSYRVMAQLPMGKVQAISRNDEGLSKLMNLTLDKYIIPNANAQFDFLTKCRMVDMYSNVYGNFFTFNDWDIKKNGYIGPDNWMINIRDVFPQVGAMSPEDSDFILIRTWHPISYFEALDGKEGYKNIKKILAKLKENSGQKDSRSVDDKTARDDNEFSDPTANRGDGYYAVYSMYERDRWVDYVEVADEIFRDGKNPQDNGELPVICKYSIPLMDDYMGMGDFERGKSMQYGLNSLWNLYMDSVKMSIFPPVMINKDNIASASSIKFAPGAKWLGRNNIGNFAQPLTLSPQGTYTFNAAFQAMNASLLNQFGTTDTTVSASTDQTMGKTPQALEMQAQRENTRDNADKFYMEQFLKKTINRFINMVSKKQSGAITLRLFGSEIEELVSSYPEMAELYDQRTGKFSIPKSKMGSVLFDYEMVSGSTYQVNQKVQQDNLASTLQLFINNPNLKQQILQEEGINVKMGEMIKRMLANSNVPKWDEIVVDQNEDGGAQDEQVLNEHMNQFMGALQQVNEVPPQPGMEQPMMGGMEPNAPQVQGGY